jgi:NitT/TauT family transport system substrate-binding protein
MNRRSASLLAVLALGVSVWVAACGSTTGSTASSAAQPAGSTAAASRVGDAAAPASAPPTREKIQLAISLTDISFLVFGVAELAGIADSEGVDLEIVTAGTNVAVTAITSGEIGYTGQIGSVMRAAAQGLEARAIAVFMDSPLQSIVVRPETRTPQDLIGKTIAVSTANATTHAAAIAMLETAGVRENQLQWAFLGAQSARYGAFEQGLVQATVLTPPLDVIAERDGGYRNLLRAAELIRSPYVGVGTSVQRIRERPAEVKRLLRVLIRANEYMREHPAETAEIAARWAQIDDPDAVKRSLEQMYPALTRGGAANRSGFTAELASIQKLAQLSAPPKIEDVADFRPLEEVQRDMGLPVGGLRD